MLKMIKRLTCRHSYMWSERRKQDVCYNCARVRLASETAEGSPVTLDATIEPEREHT